MTMTSMLASNAQDIAHRRIGHVRATLTRDAKYLADDAARYAASLANDGEDTGEASRIAQAALQIAMLAATMKGMTEVGAFLDAVVDDAEPEGD